MDYDYRAIVKDLTAERDEVAAQMEGLQRRHQSLMQAIEGLQGLVSQSEGVEEIEYTPPSPPAPEVARIPRGAEAIKIVLRETGQRLNSTEINNELERRGWSPRSKNPENATSSNAARASETVHEIMRARDASGHYLYWWQEEREPEPDESRLSIVREDREEVVTS